MRQLLAASKNRAAKLYTYELVTFHMQCFANYLKHIHLTIQLTQSSFTD